MLNKRAFVTGTLMTAALAAAAATGAPMGGHESRRQKGHHCPQKPDIPHGMVKTTKLFKGPPGYINALAVAPEGIWLGQQKRVRQHARSPITCLSLPICMKPPGLWIGTASC